MKYLSHVYLGSNQIHTIEVGALCNIDNLYDIGLWSNRLKSLPLCLTSNPKLRFFDARYNYIPSIDDEALLWCDKLKYCRMSNNPLCLSKKYKNKKICEQQCAMNCPKVWLGNSICDDEVYDYEYFAGISSKYIGVAFEDEFIQNLPRNGSGCLTKECNYDNGDCGSEF